MLQPAYLLNILKPCGMTSHEVVARLRRLLPKKTKVGHLGTLDPDASGVLPLAVGRATKIIPYVKNNTKGYRALIQLGVETDTDDWTGRVLREKSFNSGLSLCDIQEVADRFKGSYRQVPPQYSALKVEGTRSYERARRGEKVDLEAREVRVDQIACYSWDPNRGRIMLDISCGGGTYIRSFARDLANSLGTLGCLAGLLRWNSNDFWLSDSVCLEALCEKTIACNRVEPESVLTVDETITMSGEAEECTLRFRKLEKPTGSYILKSHGWRAFGLVDDKGEAKVVARWKQHCE